MIIVFIKLFLFPLLSPLCVGIIRKIKAFMQNRKGASVFQPYYDIWKLFHKDEVIARDASWIFRFTPFLLFGISLLLSISISFVSTQESLFFFGDFITVVYLLAAMTFFLSLAGLDTGGMFGGFGASREMTLAALTEAGLIFSFLPVALIAHTTNLSMIPSAIANMPLIAYFSVFIAFLAFFIALIAETGRVPFDNPATHLELTMIHEAMILEYSGKRLALIEWASANKLLFFVIAGVNIFFPWGLAGTPEAGTLLLAIIIVCVKVLLLLTVIAVLESRIAKYRYFRLADILMTGFIFCIIALITIAI